MKFSPVTLLGFAAAIAASSPGLSKVPACALSCIETLVPEHTPCSTDDVSCICNYQQKLQDNGVECVVDACGIEKAMDEVLPCFLEICGGSEAPPPGGGKPHGVGKGPGEGKPSGAGKPPAGVQASGGGDLHDDEVPGGGGQGPAEEEQGVDEGDEGDDEGDEGEDEGDEGDEEGDEGDEEDLGDEEDDDEDVDEDEGEGDEDEGDEEEVIGAGGAPSEGVTETEMTDESPAAEALPASTYVTAGASRAVNIAGSAAGIAAMAGLTVLAVF
ncbi:hypothetical protein VMCG_07842 [Cytospora schulzeri]|uniref:CFEM domain-containing protein n=1 Tax=Cytospora schulzeri TaxID=448051 RepID=A0A423VZU0_9PEZI|nr:hypothetical protein VMCG_07842 [Valsa malicola]